MNYFDKDETVATLSGTLPHWRQKGKTYFVTFRTADSIPQAKLKQWEAEKKAWLVAHPEPHDAQTKREFYDLFPHRLQRWLDAGFGACLLARPELKQLVEDALCFFSGQRYELDEFIVMPNHVHVIVAPTEEYDLSDILHSWKSFTATKINKLIGCTGPFWQKESFDHIIRNPEQHERIRLYIRENPIIVKTARFENQRQDAAATIEQLSRHCKQSAQAIVTEASSLCGHCKQNTEAIVAEVSSLCARHELTEEMRGNTYGQS